MDAVKSSLSSTRAAAGSPGTSAGAQAGWRSRCVQTCITKGGLSFYAVIGGHSSGIYTVILLPLLVRPDLAGVDGLDPSLGECREQQCLVEYWLWPQRPLLHHPCARQPPPPQPSSVND